MYLVKPHTHGDALPERRKHSRCSLQCRARIVIGNRHYAGYIHDISPAGAKLRTITLIRRVGAVVLTLPDLSPLHCRLRWTDGYNAGVEFVQPLSPREFADWAEEKVQSRQLRGIPRPLLADVAEPAMEAVGA